MPDMCDVIRKKTSTPAQFEQLAEEATELAHAALKVARIIRGESPTMVSAVEAQRAVEEETADVIACMFVIGDKMLNRKKVTDLAAKKCVRWFNRLLQLEE